MKYFRMNFTEAVQAMKEVWKRQDEAEIPHTPFRVSAEGMDASIWTDDPEGEVVFRQVLADQGFSSQEGDEQQVRTWLDASSL